MATAWMLHSGRFDEHLHDVRRKLQHARANALADHLEAELPDGFELRLRPSGGFFCWVDHAASVDTDELLDAAEARRMSFAAGHRFGAGARGARLCFAAANAVTIREAAARFVRAARSVCSER